MWEQAETHYRWADWAISQVEHCPDSTQPADPDASLNVSRAALDAS